MDVARLQAEPVHRRQMADGVAALAVPHQFWFCGRARGEIEQHRVVGVGRSVGCKSLGGVGRLRERQPAVVPRVRADHDAHQIFAAEAGEFCHLVLRRDHRPRPSPIEPVAQFIRRQQGGGGDHDNAELHCRQHGLPERHNIAEQQEQVVAALQPLRAQEVCHLAGAARQRREGEFCFPVAAGVDDPQRRTVLAIGILREAGVEPVQRPVERHRIGPAEFPDSGGVVRAVFQQKGARFLKGRHRLPVIFRRGSERAG